MLITSERGIGNWLKRFCTKRSYRIIKLNPAQHTGLPDRLILTTNGQSVYVELKSEGASLRPMQEDWGKWLIRNNHYYLVLDVLDDNVSDLLTNYFDMAEQVSLNVKEATALAERIRKYKRER
jgi:hypothetical protein